MNFLKRIGVVAFLMLALGISVMSQITIGTGTSTQRYPLGNFYGFERSAAIYTAAEVTTTGSITKVAWYPTAASTTSRPIKIYIKETTASTITAATWASTISGATLAFDGASGTIAANAWKEFTLTTPFSYTGGANNLLVLVEANIGGTGTGGSGGTSVQYSTATNQHEVWFQDNTAPTTSGTVTSFRPNIQLTIGALAALDMGAATLIAPVTTGCYGAAEPVTVQIRNYGTATIDYVTNPVTVTTNVTGAATQTLMATLNSGTLAAGATQNVTMSGTLDMTAAGTYTFNASTSVTGDGNAGNDAMPAANRVATTATALPYSQDFGTGTTFPASWTNGPGTWNVSTTHGQTGSGLNKNIYSAAATGQFAIQKLGMVSANDSLSFDYRLVNFTSYPATATPNSPAWGNIKIQVSTDCGGTFTDFQTIDPTNHISTTNWANKNYPLASFAGQDVIIRFLATWTAGDYYVDLDNFNIGPPPLPNVSFSSATYSTNENAGTATITVNRTGDTAPAISVNYATSDGTATAGSDYTAASGTLNFGIGEVSKTFNIPITPDFPNADPDETVNIALSMCVGCNIVAPATAVLTIADSAPPLNGVYTVGAGGDYPSLTNNGGIFQSMNNNGVAGNVTINIISDLTGELGTNALNSFAGGYTVLIKPSGAARSVSGTGANLIKINGADNITIDGSLSGGTDRSLTISTTGSGSLIWLASTVAADGATNNTVKNCFISGGGGTITGDGILTSGSVAGNVAEAANSGNTFQNNAVSRTFYGISLVGPTGNEMGNSILQNEVGSTFTADKLGLVGIFIAQQANASVSENSIFGVTTATTSTSSGIQAVGAMNGVSINRNQISDIKNTNSTGYGTNGIQLGSSSTTANLTVSNNFIWDIAANGYAPGFGIEDNGYGMIITSGGGYNIYNNSVNLNTDQTTAGNGIAFNITGGVTTAGAIDLRNNIFANAQTAGNTRYTIYSGAANTVFSMIDYNDYFTNGSALGFIGTARTALSDIQAGFGGNANSKNVDPMFVSPTDLHLNVSSSLLGMATPIPGITNDFDGDPRPATIPDIGADEIVQSQMGSIPAGTYYNAFIGNGDTLAGDVTVNNLLTLSGISNTGANTLTLGCDTSVSGAGLNNYVVGNVAKQFCSSGSFTFPVGTTPDAMVANGIPASEYTPFTANITALGIIPSTLKVSVTDGFMTDSDTMGSISRYWDVTETGDVTADITFTYLDQDVNGTEANYAVLRRASMMTLSYPGGMIDTVNNIGSAPNVSNFSQWGAGRLAPTAASVNIGGRVLTPTGRGIARARVFMIDSQGNVVMRQTNPFGYYRFTDVPAGGVYVFSVEHKTYRFAEPSRALLVDEENFGIDFISTGNQNFSDLPADEPQK